jgi:hypothetical protein
VLAGQDADHDRVSGRHQTLDLRLTGVPLVVVNISQASAKSSWREAFAYLEVRKPSAIVASYHGFHFGLVLMRWLC